MKIYILLVLIITSLTSSGLLACGCCGETQNDFNGSHTQNIIKKRGAVKIPAGIYVDFLNDKGKDSHDLFDERMSGTDQTPALIICSETANGYSYEVVPGEENANTLYVSEKNADLFFDWLNENRLSMNTEIENGKTDLYKTTSYGDCGCRGSWDSPFCICLMYCQCGR